VYDGHTHFLKLLTTHLSVEDVRPLPPHRGLTRIQPPRAPMPPPHPRCDAHIVSLLELRHHCLSHLLIEKLASWIHIPFWLGYCEWIDLG
jgi:hypothetical protein